MPDREANHPHSQLASRTFLVCGIVLAVAAVVGILFVARSILPLVFGAILLAVVLNRLASWIGQWIPTSLSRRGRIALVVTTSIVLASVIVFVFANAASDQILKLTDRVEASIDRVIQVAKDQPLIKKYMSSESSNFANLLPSSDKSIGVAKGFLATAFGGLADGLILTILALYFAFRPDKYRKGLLRLLPIGWRDRTAHLLDESSTTLWRWMLGRVLAMSLVGILFGVGLLMIGVPMAIELGVFAGLVTFIPNLGGIIAVIPALLLASQQSSTALISVGTLYLVIQFVESYLITPLVQEQQVSLPPAMIILAQIISGLLFGFWGIVFATPIFAVLQLWVRRLYVEDWIEA